ncbi:MAG: spinster family MFS transporter [Sphingopyxis sp.]
MPPIATTPTADQRATRILLWTLLVIYILNFLDRQIVSILAEPIKRDLHLSDTQIGLMTGLAFALFYTVLGIPIARYADNPRTNRVTLISASLAIWSVMTMACGQAHNFGQILLARIGVGVGEAGCTPAAHSLISDAVPVQRRPSAIAFYGLGIPIGGLLGMIIGGQLSDAFGWRVAFMAVGVPGVIMAVGLRWIIRDPRMAALLPGMAAGEPADAGATAGAASAEAAGAAVERLSARAALAEIFRSRAFVLLAAAASVTAFLSYGKGVWVVILFIRSYGLSEGETGLLLGIVLGLAGVVGTWLGGFLADRYGRVNRRHVLTGPALGMAVAAPILFMGYWVTDWRLSIALLFVPTLLNAAYYGPTYATVQGLVRPQARAMASAMMLFAQNIIGLGLGPLFFGILSDALRPVAGADSVRWVLYGAAWLGIIPALLFWRASLRLNREMTEHGTAR